MSSPYGTVSNHPMCPPGYRVSAYYWAVHRGLPADLGFLFELGRRAARAASWLGIAPVRIPEGPEGRVAFASVTSLAKWIVTHPPKGA